MLLGEAGGNSQESLPFSLAVLGACGSIDTLRASGRIRARSLGGLVFETHLPPEWRSTARPTITEHLEKCRLATDEWEHCGAPCSWPRSTRWSLSRSPSLGVARVEVARDVGSTNSNERDIWLSTHTHTCKKPEAVTTPSFLLHVRATQERTERQDINRSVHSGAQVTVNALPPHHARTNLCKIVARWDQHMRTQYMYEHLHDQNRCTHLDMAGISSKLRTIG